MNFVSIKCLYFSYCDDYNKYRISKKIRFLNMADIINYFDQIIFFLFIATMLVIVVNFIKKSLNGDDD